jgi:undecaprenyl diphosphate synthase
MPRVAGHRAGAEAVDRISEEAARLGVEHLTLYAFSTENWQRPKKEVSTLWKLLVRDLRRRGPKCLRNGIRLTFIGRTDRMPPSALAELERVAEQTRHCDRMALCLALDYGGRWDLCTMVERVRELERLGELPPGPLRAEDLGRLLPSGQVPPVDLLIRTGGESRISNFLPWQLTYAELLFVPKLWPDFDEQDLGDALETYARKHRRFGRIEEDAPQPAKAGE